jgi:hypothetical protein
VPVFQALGFPIYGSSWIGQDYVLIFKLCSSSKGIKSNRDDCEINDSVKGCAEESNLQFREQIM